jgi:hypothetical protein
MNAVCLKPNFFGRSAGRILVKAFALVLVAGFAIGAFFMLGAGHDIIKLLGENRNLREAITNLTEQRQIGYAKVLDQKMRDGALHTRLLFVVTDPENKNRRVLEREYEIKGDVIHFDALIVRFGQRVVMDGKDKAMYLWRRVYGEGTPPAQGFTIQKPGKEPEQYRGLFKKLPLDQRNLFWDEVWQLANDDKRLAAAGVQAIYGNAVYTQLKPGLIYVFNLDANGAFYPETVPAL